MKMTQDIKYMASMCTVTNKSANESLELEASGEGSSPQQERTNDEFSILKEQLSVAKDNIQFLQNEHASMLKGLHEEIGQLQGLCRDLQFRCEAEGCLLPDSEFFLCGAKLLEQKVNNLINENSDLKRKLAESHQAIDILDQKEKLALWQHHQELEQRDETISYLEKELEAKCNTIAQLTVAQGARRKKSNFWRRFSFSSSFNIHCSASFENPPSTRRTSQQRRSSIGNAELFCSL